MTFTVFSFIMSIILFSTISTLCCLLLSRTNVNWLWVISFVLGLCFLRCVLPVEVKNVYVINCWNIYPILLEFVQYKVWNKVEIINIICFVWFTGCFIALVKQSMEIFRQAHLNCATKIFFTDSKVQNIVKKIEKDIDCKRKVEVYVVESFIVPTMIGFTKPIILISQDTLDLKDNEIEYILRHEICHFKGGDIWIRLMVQLLVCILWWNPVVYLIRHSVIQLLEIRCDDRACSSLMDDEKMEYITVLIESLKYNLNRKRSSLAAGFVGNYYKSFVRQRIKILLSPMSIKPSLRKVCLTIGICIFLFIGSYAIVFQPAFEPTEEFGVHALSIENAWIVHSTDDKYEIWIEGCYLDTLTLDALKTEPFNQLQIYEEEDLP